MQNYLARTSWAWIVRGILSVVFGVLAFVLPGVTLSTLVLFFGAFACVDGIMALVAVATKHTWPQPWRWVLMEGIVGSAAGIFVFLYPGLTLVALIYLIAGWSLVTGVFEIIAAVLLRREIAGEWALALSGILSILFGILVAVVPVAGVLVLAWIIGAYAVMFGVSMIALGFRFRNDLTINRGEFSNQTRRPLPSH